MISRIAVGGLGLVLSCCWAAGCGGVDVDRQGDAPLKVLELSPRDGEVGVPPTTDVVAVFSAAMAVGEGDDKLNERTFYVEDTQGARLSDTARLSVLDEQSATAVIRLAELDAGASYTVVLAAGLQGEGTAPLGSEIRATFRVAE